MTSLKQNPAKNEPLDQRQAQLVLEIARFSAPDPSWFVPWTLEQEDEEMDDASRIRLRAIREKALAEIDELLKLVSSRPEGLKPYLDLDDRREGNSDDASPEYWFKSLPGWKLTCRRQFAIENRPERIFLKIDFEFIFVKQELDLAFRSDGTFNVGALPWDLDHLESVQEVEAFPFKEKDDRQNSTE